MGVTQRLAYHDTRKVVSQAGERFSGKTFGGLHALVKHLWEGNNAQGLVLVSVKSSGTSGGAWEKLNSQECDRDDNPIGVLAIWKQALAACGFDYTEPRSDLAKNEYIEVKNRHGRWNKCYFKSLPPGATIQERTRGIEASFILWDEWIESAEAKQHLVKLIQVIGRRRGVYRLDDSGDRPDLAQQFYLCCNPPTNGPDNAAAKLLFITRQVKAGRRPVGRVDGDVLVFDHNDDPEVAHYHVPLRENIFISPEDQASYRSNLEMEAADDPTAGDRLIGGIWKRKPTGNGLFHLVWKPEHHVRPSLEERGTAFSGLKPSTVVDVIVGWDPGQVWDAKVFLQRHRVIGGRIFWRVLHSIHVRQERLNLEYRAADFLEAQLYLNRLAGQPLNYVMIADRQALDNYNPAGDSVEAQMFGEICQRLIAERPEYREAQVPLMDAPEKGAGSRYERFRLLSQMLQSGELIVSGSCGAVIRMFEGVRQTRKSVDQNKFDLVRNEHIHVFDALTYPQLYFRQRQSLITEPPQEEKKLDCTIVRLA